MERLAAVLLGDIRKNNEEERKTIFTDDLPSEFNRQYKLMTTVTLSRRVKIGSMEIGK